jgi:hypothetical protein
VILYFVELGIKSFWIDSIILFSILESNHIIDKYRNYLMKTKYELRIEKGIDIEKKNNS